MAKRPKTAAAAGPVGPPGAPSTRTASAATAHPRVAARTLSSCQHAPCSSQCLRRTDAAICVPRERQWLRDSGCVLVDTEAGCRCALPARSKPLPPEPPTHQRPAREVDAATCCMTGMHTHTRARRGPPEQHPLRGTDPTQVDHYSERTCAHMCPRTAVPQKVSRSTVLPTISAGTATDSCKE